MTTTTTTTTPEVVWTAGPDGVEFGVVEDPLAHWPGFPAALRPPEPACVVVGVRARDAAALRGALAAVDAAAHTPHAYMLAPVRGGLHCCRAAWAAAVAGAAAAAPHPDPVDLHWTAGLHAPLPADPDDPDDPLHGRPLMRRCAQQTALVDAAARYVCRAPVAAPAGLRARLAAEPMLSPGLRARLPPPPRAAKARGRREGDKSPRDGTPPRRGGRGRKRARAGSPDPDRSGPAGGGGGGEGPAAGPPDRGLRAEPDGPVHPGGPVPQVPPGDGAGAPGGAPHPGAAAV